MTVDASVRATGRREPSAADSSDATRRMLFGHLPTEDAASAVARRLRTAIGLGVLADGEKLPKEKDLAEQLGVTAFSLREALGVLRGEGLIVTRVGKNGGSYVERPTGGESLAGDQLVRLSATELRDLGDWRAALTTFAAWLAAQRGDEATDARLAECIEELSVATDSGAARRALGRFHVELSAGAQSMRLTRAELVVHEEFDWLVQVLLEEADQRQAIAKRMEAIRDAVSRSDANSAWEAGEQMVSYVLTELMRARLHRLAVPPAPARRSNRRRSRDLAAELQLLLERTVKQLDEIGHQLSGAFDQAPTARELNAEVARRVLPRLGQLDEIVHGLGFMAEPGLVPDAYFWMEWWQRAADGAFDRDYSHQLDPGRDDFYDYGSRDYLIRPRESGEPNAMGPYIDHGGVDDYLVTLSVPVRNRDSFVGIMAADVRVADLERAVSAWLAQADGACVLLNAESRVLLSNSVRYNVGDMVRAEADFTLDEVGCFGWLIGRGPDDLRDL